ncbi:uncharacterized protein LOC127636438 [Xyrauchen texanus]|uniref:uncharacterized protein LOC127636438 n=1 Tax=Xyrauchen texanus TaxID=154827 RepID=UPI002241E97D|nr:uncharacterized protein LOC127636438 [Xyrauchen texanus]
MSNTLRERVARQPLGTLNGPPPTALLHPATPVGPTGHTPLFLLLFANELFLSQHPPPAEIAELLNEGKWSAYFTQCQGSEPPAMLFGAAADPLQNCFFSSGYLRKLSTSICWAATWTSSVNSSRKWRLPIAPAHQKTSSERHTISSQCSADHTSSERHTISSQCSADHTSSERPTISSQCSADHTSSERHTISSQCNADHTSSERHTISRRRYALLGSCLSTATAYHFLFKL